MTRPTTWLTTLDRRQLLTMTARIAAIIFLVEAAIMAVLSTIDFTDKILEGIIDSTALTLISSPLIYLWVAQPFHTAANEARTALDHELKRQAGHNQELKQAFDESQRLLASNEDLRQRLQQTSRDIANITEQTLQRVGQDLHDGPAQLLTYAMLRIGRLETMLTSADEPADKELKRMRLALEDTLREVRNLCTGLTLPELQHLAIIDVVKLAVTSHEELTGTHVEQEVDPKPLEAPHQVKIALYRLIQESLTNAFWHAEGKGQKVVVTCGPFLQVTVSDSGPGLPSNVQSLTGLGLKGIRARVEALGGRYAVASSAATGVQISASFCEAALAAKEITHG